MGAGESATGSHHMNALTDLLPSLDLDAELLRQIQEVGRHDLKCRIRGQIWHVLWTVLQVPCNEARIHPLRLGSSQIVLVSGTHHDLMAGLSKQGSVGPERACLFVA